MTLTVTVCVPLSSDPSAAIGKIAAEGGHDVSVVYAPELLPSQRFPADHRGDPRFARSSVDERRWRQILAATDVALGFPGDSPAGLQLLVQLAPSLRWVQGTAAGAGEQVAAAQLDEVHLNQLQITSAAGIHARPLAEFALFGLLAFAKDIDVLQESSHAREWRTRWPMRSLHGSQVVVLGLGGVGREVARLCAAFGAQVTGVRRHVEGRISDGVANMVTLDELDHVLMRADAVVVTLPGTPATRGLLDARRLALLPTHAVLVNVGRGSVVDSAALANALDNGKLRGAVIDVADVEPLPPESVLWGRANVIISPHTAALSVEEDDRILDLFIDNLDRFLTGRPLRNVVDLDAGY